MKRIFVCVLFGVLSVANAANFQDSPLFEDCVMNEKKVSCQKLIDSGLPSLKDCSEEDCNDIGTIYFAARNHQQAIKYFEMAAYYYGDAWGYYNLGVLYDTGEGVRQNFYKAFGLYQKACKQNHAAACHNLAVLYYHGQGVKEDLAMAKKYYNKACRLGVELSCDRYKSLNKSTNTTKNSQNK